MNRFLQVELYYYEQVNFKSSDLSISREAETALILQEEGSLTLESSGCSTTIISSPALSILSLNMKKYTAFGTASLLKINNTILADLIASPYSKGIDRILKPFLLDNRELHFTLANDQISGLKQILNRIAIEKKMKFKDSDAVIQLLLLEILIQLGRLTPLKSEDLKSFDNTSALWSVQETISFIHEHYDEALSLEQLSKRCGFNQSYFSRVFKEESGVALFEYINRLRIKGACRLLRNSKMSILEIAYAVGYNNVSFFNRYFKRIHNMSPGQYRKK